MGGEGWRIVRDTDADGAAVARQPMAQPALTSSTVRPRFLNISGYGKWRAAAPLAAELPSPARESLPLWATVALKSRHLVRWELGWFRAARWNAREHGCRCGNTSRSTDGWWIPTRTAIPCSPWPGEGKRQDHGLYAVQINQDIAGIVVQR
jgi:hypothetical protein